MGNLVLPSEKARELSMHSISGLTLVNSYIVDEWRWGVVHEMVVKDSEGNLWGYTYKEQTGDMQYTSFEDEDEIEFYPMKAVEKTITLYQKA